MTKSHSLQAEDPGKPAGVIGSGSKAVKAKGANDVNPSRRAGELEMRMSQLKQWGNEEKEQMPRSSTCLLLKPSKDYMILLTLGRASHFASPPVQMEISSGTPWQTSKNNVPPALGHPLIQSSFYITLPITPHSGITTQQQTLISNWQTHKHGWISKLFCWMKEVRQKYFWITVFM